MSLPNSSKFLFEPLCPFICLFFLYIYTFLLFIIVEPNSHVFSVSVCLHPHTSQFTLKKKNSKMIDDLFLSVFSATEEKNTKRTVFRNKSYARDGEKNRMEERIKKQRFTGSLTCQVEIFLKFFIVIYCF